MKGQKVLLSSIVAFILMAGAAFAGGCGCGGVNSGSMGLSCPAPKAMNNQKANTQTTALAAQAVNVGNKICPVMGGQISDPPKVTYEYEGKIYNFCCPGCIATFQQDPAKYIAIVEAELQARTTQVK